MWRSPIVLKRGRSSEPLEGDSEISGSPCSNTGSGLPHVSRPRAQQEGQRLESCRAAGRLKRKVRESAFTVAEAPSRGRQPLPQAASQGAGGMRSSVR